jgi:Mce-associated membrane protein
MAEEGEVLARSGRRRLQLNGISPLRMALAAGLAFAVALGALCGWFGYRAHQQDQDDHFRALLVQVGRQGAVSLTTIDYKHAEADVQRILDSATGEFYDDFKSRSGPFIDVVKKAQSTSVGTVTEAGLESTNGREGQVLVAVTVKSTNDGTPDEQPRYWRMRMTVGQQGEDVKVSKVDFVR